MPDFGQIVNKKFGIIKAVINPIVGFKKNLIEMKKGIFEKKMNFITGIGKGMKKMMGKMRNNFNLGIFFPCLLSFVIKIFYHFILHF